MFEGEKTALFWIGLILMSLSSLLLFGMLWTIGMYNPSYLGNALVSFVPIIVGAIVFIFIGIYMMKSGVKKKAASRIVPATAS